MHSETIKGEYESMKERLCAFFSKPFWSNYRTLFGLWILLALIAATMKMHSHNNFLIFKGVFHHAWEQISLYAEYPAEHWDTNHYGPLFSLIIAPFAIVPDWLGLILWCLALTLFLYWAVRRSLLTQHQQIFIFWFCAHELLTALYMQQFNIAIAAFILLSFFLIEKEKDGWAAFFIVVGTLVKLYGIVGLAFFFFSKHKVNFILSLIGWSVFLFIAPMLISSPEYILGQYQEWMTSLTGKNIENLFATHQNISLLGIVRKVSSCASYSDLWLIVPGLALFALPYLRFPQYKNMAFRQTLLASVLMFVVLFSTGSESSGYIIALIGVVIWYTAVPWPRTNWDVALLVFAFILTSLSPSDLFPKIIREQWVQSYALKALPVSIIWFKLCWEMTFRDYSRISLS